MKNNIGIVHLLGAVMVIWGHSFALLNENAPQAFGIKIHTLGVIILFVVAGYLSAASWRKSSGLFGYLKRKIVRIYPPFILCIVITVLVMQLVTKASLNEYWISAISYLKSNAIFKINFVIDGVFEDNVYPLSVNGSLWTLPIECFCFLVVPIWELLKNKIADIRIKNGVLISLIILAKILSIYLQATVDVYIYNMSLSTILHYGVYFFVGNLLYDNLDKHCKTEYALGMCLALCGLDNIAGEIIGVICIPYIVMTFALTESVFDLKYISKINYEIYLYAFPVAQLIIHYAIQTGNSLKPYMLFCLTTVITTVFALFIKRFEDYVGHIVKEIRYEK